MAGEQDGSRHGDPTKDKELLTVANQLLAQFKPALLLITLGEQGMLLCRQGQPVFHVPTAAKAAGASPEEAAVFSNHAAGVVVGKFGTATVSPEELIASFADAKHGGNGTGPIASPNHSHNSAASTSNARKRLSVPKTRV